MNFDMMSMKNFQSGVFEGGILRHFFKTMVLKGVSLVVWSDPLEGIRKIMNL